MLKEPKEGQCKGSMVVGGRGVGNGLVGDPCKHILVSAMEKPLEKVLVGE